MIIGDTLTSRISLPFLQYILSKGFAAFKMRVFLGDIPHYPFYSTSILYYIQAPRPEIVWTKEFQQLRNPLLCPRGQRRRSLLRDQASHRIVVKDKDKDKETIKEENTMKRPSKPPGHHRSTSNSTLHFVLKSS